MSLQITEGILETPGRAAQSFRVLELGFEHRNCRIVLARKNGVCSGCADVNGIARLRMNGIEKRLCLRDIASQLKTDRKKTDDRCIFRTQITGSTEMFPGC